MKRFIFLFIMMFIFIACDDLDPQIISNSDAITSKVMIGEDDTRHQVTCVDPDEKCGVPDFHARRSGYLMVQFKGQKQTYNNCAAYMVASNWAITSAHCIYDSHKGVAEDITLFSGQVNKNYQGWPRDFIEEAWIMTDFMKIVDNEWNYSSIHYGKNPHEYDIALLKLANPGGQDDNQKDGHSSRVGYNDIFYMEDDFIYEKDGTPRIFEAEIVGYPADKEEKSSWKAVCNLKKYNDKLWEHECDTAPGSSGGAILLKHPKWTPQMNKKIRQTQREDRFIDIRWVFGVHAGGNVGDQKNYATMITKQRYDNIRDIIKKKTSPRDPKMFTKFKISTEKYFGADIRNTCDKPAWYAYRYKNLQGNWVTSGFHIIAGKEDHKIAPTTHDLMRTKEKYFYVYAVEKEGGYAGDDLVYGRNYFKSSNQYIMLDEYGDIVRDSSGHPEINWKMFERLKEVPFKKIYFKRGKGNIKHFDQYSDIDC